MVVVSRGRSSGMTHRWRWFWQFFVPSQVYPFLLTNVVLLKVYQQPAYLLRLKMVWRFLLLIFHGWYMGSCVQMKICNYTKNYWRCWRCYKTVKWKRLRVEEFALKEISASWVPRLECESKYSYGNKLLGIVRSLFERFTANDETRVITYVETEKSI